MSVAVVGAGAFGTALAISMAQTQNVTLWARDKAHAVEMESSRENARRLPQVLLPDQVAITFDLSAALSAEIILLAVPMQALAAFAAAANLAGKTIVAIHILNFIWQRALGRHLRAVKILAVAEHWNDLVPV